jgi:hypothetical protein
MGHLRAISVDRLQIVENWKVAPPGKLLQVTTPYGKPMVGMRCENVVQGQPTPCFLVIDQNIPGDNGRLIEDDIILNPALDVSGILDVQVQSPCIVKFKRTLHDSIGMICESNAGSGRLFIRAAHGSLRGYVLISDPSHSATVGTFTSQEPPDLYALGQAIIGERP